MSTERITRLQSLLERIKRNAALPKSAINVVFGGTRTSGNDVSAGPSVPVASLAHSQTDAAAAAPLIPVHSIELESAQVESPTPPMTGGVRIPTIAGMVSPVAELKAAAQPAPKPSGKPAPVLEIIEELDIDDVDVVDITTEPPPPPSFAPQVSAPPVEVRDDELTWSEPPGEEEPAVQSSPRARVAATSLDEALAEAAEAEAESTEPLKTPPPQSGRQPTEGVYAAAIPQPTVADFLPQPTAEQLGQTVELEAPTSARLELDIPAAQAQKPKEDLEFELPLPASALELPSRAEVPTFTDEAADAEPVDSAPSRIRQTPEDVDTVETAAVVLPLEAAAPSTDRDTLPPVAELTTRNTEGKEVTPEFVFAPRKFAPKSFADLLDASLSLVPKQ